MKHQVYFGIAIRWILLIVVAMMATFIPEHLRDFFGDKLYPSDISIYDRGAIDIYWSWGARHYWYFWGITILFLFTLINFGISIYNIIVKHYPKSK